jgi:tRNA A-37 threonylcarbamoyl transferase component Bud32
MHVDCNSKESILIYPYFRDTLLALLEGDPAFPPEGRLKIMRDIGEAIRELHAKDWVHTGLFCALLNVLPS